MIIYFFILLFSIHLGAMESGKKSELPLVDRIARLPREIQSEILLAAKLPPHDYYCCGEREFVTLNNGNLEIATAERKEAAQAIYYPTKEGVYYTGVREVVDSFKTIRNHTGVSGSINSSHIALKRGLNNLILNPLVEQQNSNREEIISLQNYPDWFELNDYRLFLKYDSKTIFLRPFDFPEFGVVSSCVLDHQKKEFERIDFKKICAQNQQLKELYKAIDCSSRTTVPELHYIAVPFDSTSHLIPLILKLTNYKDNQYKLITALYNMKEKALYSWPISEIPKSLGISLKASVLSNRIPTQEELHEQILPPNVLSKTDLYILTLSEKAIDWMKKAIKFSQYSQQHCTNLDTADGFRLLKEYYDKNNVLELKNREKFRWATKNGTYGDIIDQIMFRMQNMPANKQSVKEEYIKNHIIFLLGNKE